MLQLSTKELFTVIEKKDDYQEEAVEAAKEEIINRGFQDKLEVLLSEVEKIKAVKEAEELQQPELYSLNSLFTFSVFFSPIWGGILFYQNFKKLNKNIIGIVVLILSILFTSTIFSGGNVNANIILLGITLHVIGGGVLTVVAKVFYPKDIDYRNRKTNRLIGYAVVSLIIYIALIYGAKVTAISLQQF